MGLQVLGSFAPELGRAEGGQERAQLGEVVRRLFIDEESRHVDADGACLFGILRVAAEKLLASSCDFASRDGAIAVKRFELERYLLERWDGGVAAYAGREQPQAEV